MLALQVSSTVVPPGTELAVREWLAQAEEEWVLTVFKIGNIDGMSVTLYPHTSCNNHHLFCMGGV